MNLTVLKYGIGYDLVVVEESYRQPRQARQIVLILGIRCHTCKRTSFNPNDIRERYCGACHKFHEENLLSHEA